LDSENRFTAATVLLILLGFVSKNEEKEGNSWGPVVWWMGKGLVSEAGAIPHTHIHTFFPIKKGACKVSMEVMIEISKIPLWQ
jgi:hypothetical protein